MKEASVPEDKAAATAEEVASFENRLANVKPKLTLLTWMAGFNIAVTFLVLGKLFMGTGR